MQNSTHPNIRYERINEEEPKAQLPKTAIVFSGVLGFLAIAAFVALQVAFPGAAIPRAPSADTPRAVQQALGPTVASAPSAPQDTRAVAFSGSLNPDMDWDLPISQLTPVNIDGVAVSKISERWSLAPLEAFNRFHRERRINLAFPVKGHLLDPAIDEATRNATIAEIANRECLAATQSFADACALYRANWFKEVGSLWAEMRLQLVYTQKSEFGPMPAANLTSPNGRAGVYTERQMDLTSRGRRGLRARSVAASAKHRQTLYADAGRKCAAMAKREGNCAIQNINIRTAPNTETAVVTEGSVAVGRIGVAGS